MKRLFLMLAVVAATVASPLALEQASAQDRGRGRPEARDDRGDWAARRGGGEDRRWRGGEERRGPRYEDRRGGNRFEAPRRRDEGRQYAPPPDYRDARRGRPRTLRPGGYLPQEYRGGMIQDFGRYRLRPPPHGYAWVRVGNDFLLVSMVDGQIFDIIVD